MTYRVAAGVLAHLLPVVVGTSHETLCGRKLKRGEQLRHIAQAMPKQTPTAAAPASAITPSLGSTFIRSYHEGERRLEMRVGNAEMPGGGRQVANADTDVAALIRRILDVLGRTGNTALTTFTGGCPGLRDILTAAGVTGPPSFDWFHLAMRLQNAKQVARRACQLMCRISNRQRQRSLPKSSACAGRPGTARPRMSGLPLSVCACSCPHPRAPAAERVSRFASCGVLWLRSTAIRAARTPGWSTTPGDGAPDCGSASRSPGARPTF